MALLEKTTDYILDVLTENEELKKFPKEWLTEAGLWVKSWFLTPEDPKTTEKLSDKTKSPDYKKAVIENKLEQLQENPQFMAELAARLQAFAAEQQKIRNTLEDTEIEAGSFRQGNTNNNTGGDNIIKRSKIKVDGDFRQGNG